MEPTTIAIVSMIVLQVAQLTITIVKTIRKSDCKLGCLETHVETYEPVK